MNPLAVALIVLGAAVQILGILYFAVLADSFQTLPLILVVSVGSAIEAAGVLLIVRRRQ